MIIGFTCGAFDLLHAGHSHFLQSCKSMCDSLIIGLHTNPSIERASKNSPIQTTFERTLQLMAYSDGIIPYDTERDIENILSIYNFDKRFLGQDYIDREFTGKDICERKGIEVIFIPRIHDYSSSELRKRILGK